MSWELLRTDYKDAVWDGMKKYTEIYNRDGTKSFLDVTVYSVFDEAFFGAKDANQINEAVNAILAALEKGTDLYSEFQRFFNIQKTNFKLEADSDLAELEAYKVDTKHNMDGDYQDYLNYIDSRKTDVNVSLAQIRVDYEREITDFEQLQEGVFNTWFNQVKGQLDADAAGQITQRIDDVVKLVFNHYTGLQNADTEFLPDKSIRIVNEEAQILTVFGFDAQGNKTITETVVPKPALNDPYTYTKVTTFYKKSDTRNKRIEERFSRALSGSDMTQVVLNFGQTGTVTAVIGNTSYPISNMQANVGGNSYTIT